MKNPAVVDEKNPRLSWINSAKSNKRGQWQSAYQIKVATSSESLKNPDLWDSGKVILESGMDWSALAGGRGDSKT